MPGLTPFDVVAVAWFFLLTCGYGYATNKGSLSDSGLVRAINQRREEWMVNMAQRENRMVDVQVLANLARGNSFFASTSVLITGALAALFGSVEELQLLAAKFPFLRVTTVFMWQLKTLFLMGIFIYAFFKFAWAYRLAHYTGIMIGATPIATAKNKKQCADHAARAADLAGTVGRHANAGLRAYYFGIATLGWFIHPLVFMITILAVILVVYRREYRSRALAVISSTPGRQTHLDKN
ncbi:MAG: DUF599 domain-containing protein [Hyphomicrobiaceae bacterium]|nr:DUF599 domain-containing protein [Hyphomicrobiaceae bacterium]